MRLFFNTSMQYTASCLARKTNWSALHFNFYYYSVKVRQLITQRSIWRFFSNSKSKLIFSFRMIMLNIYIHIWFHLKSDKKQYRFFVKKYFYISHWKKSQAILYIFIQSWDKKRYLQFPFKCFYKQSGSNVGFFLYLYLNWKFFFCIYKKLETFVFIQIFNNYLFLILITWNSFSNFLKIVKKYYFYTF